MKKINKKLVLIMLTVFMTFSILGIGAFKNVFASTSSQTNTLQTAIPQNYQNDILFDALSFDLKVNETHRIIVLDTPRVGVDDQATMRNDLNWKIVQGQDVVSIDDKGVVKGLKEGVAVIEVTYPELGVTGVVAANVINPNTSSVAITTDIKENKYDILYFTENSYDYNFKVNSKDATTTKVEVNGNILNSNDNNLYTANLKDGYNIIKISAENSSGTTNIVYNIRAKKLGVEITNLTRKGNDILEGDKIKISFTGLVTPVPKVSRVYNPANTYVTYKTDMPRSESVKGKSTQYNIETQNSIEMEVTEAGTYTLSGGYVYQSWLGDKLYGEFYAGAKEANMGANLYETKCSVLPDIKIAVKKNPHYKPDMINVLVENKDNIHPGDEVILKIEGLKKPDVQYTIWELVTRYSTDIPELEQIQSENAKDDEAKLGTIKFVIPKGTKPGEYNIKSGYVYVKHGMWEDFTKEEEHYKTKLSDIKINVKQIKNEEQLKLTQKISEAKNIQKGKYTEESWNALQGAILQAEKVALNKDVTGEVVNVQIKALENAIKRLVEPKEEPSEPKGNASIETKLVEVFPGEKFKLKITAEKGNYFIYKSEIAGVSSGYKKIANEIEFNIPKDTKPGEYTLTNLAVYDVDDKFEPNTPYSIRLQLLAGRLGENKVADLSDVKVVVKEVVKEQQVEIENITGQTEFAKGGEAEITVKATNISDKVQSATLIVGIFDRKGALINYVASSQNVKDNIKLTAKMKLPNEDGYTVKAFVCDGLKTMHPISRVIQIPVK